MTARKRLLTVMAATTGIGLALSAIAYIITRDAGGQGTPWLASGMVTTLLVLIAFGFVYRSVVSAEESERRSAERFRAVIDSAHDAIIAIDARGRIETFNRAAQRIFGYASEEVIGKNVSMLMPQPYRREHDGYLNNYLSTGIPKIIGTGREVQAQRRDGSVFPIDLSVGEMNVGGQRAFIGIIRDITARHVAQRQVRELTAEMLHISRLSAMGQLSSSIAHELNQPLTAVVNYTEAARQMLSNAKDRPVPPRVIEFMEKAGGQAERAGQIIRRLRSFVEKSATERVYEDLSKVVEEASMLATIGAKVDDIAVSHELARDLPPVLIDKVQIQQVVVNLVRNAIEALNNADRRVLTVRTVSHNDGLEVAVSDTGPGIAPEIADQLFKPFVTTKTSGMGIGLSISHSIIEAHGGRLWAEPNPGGGTIFRFVVPRAVAQETAP
jgi:two-component system sensor kinase FixL